MCVCVCVCVCVFVCFAFFLVCLFSYSSETWYLFSKILCACVEQTVVIALKTSAPEIVLSLEEREVSRASKSITLV